MMLYILLSVMFLFSIVFFGIVSFVSTTNHKPGKETTTNHKPGKETTTNHK